MVADDLAQFRFKILQEILCILCVVQSIILIGTVEEIVLFKAAGLLDFKFEIACVLQ